MAADEQKEIQVIEVAKHNVARTESQGFNSWYQAGTLGEESLKQVIENYIRYYAFGDGHTSRAKRYDLHYFLVFLAGVEANVDRVRISDWTLQATNNFIDYRIRLGEAPATVSRRLATIKHFGRTLAERVPGYINPAREARGPTIKQTKPHGLSAEEIQILRGVAESELQEQSESFQLIRNRFLLELLLSTGLRADEVRLLVIGQLSEDRCWLRNVKTKGKKFRNVYLDSNVRSILEDYLVHREAELKQKTPLLFEQPFSEQKKYPVIVSTKAAQLGEPLSFGLAPKTVWRIISDYGSKARVASNHKIPNLHPHKLRHTFAHGLLDTSKDIRLVAQALGHSDVRTTMRYTERTEEEIALAIEKKIGKGL